MGLHIANEDQTAQHPKRVRAEQVLREELLLFCQEGQNSGEDDC